MLCHIKLPLSYCTSVVCQTVLSTLGYKLLILKKKKTHITIASLAYIATQVCLPMTLFLHYTPQIMWQLYFALSSSSIFCRTDTSTDSE